MAQKNYVSLNRLSDFLDNLKNKFAAISHRHTLADVTDYTVDDAFSDTSVNPVQNKVINDEFDAVAKAMSALEQVIDGKSAQSDLDAAVERIDINESAVASLVESVEEIDSAVLFTEQTLTNEQKAQARTNIGAGQPIIDVFSIPTDNIDIGSFYRLWSANLVIDKAIFKYGDTSVTYVNDLPETGQPALDVESGMFQWYCNTTDGVVYNYIDDVLSEIIATELGTILPVGWCTFNALYEALGIFINYPVVIGVRTLPECGVPMADLSGGGDGMCLYYNVADNAVYSYVNSAISDAYALEGITLSNGWHPFERIFELLGGSDGDYGGVITSIDDADVGIYVLAEYDLYSYGNNWEPVQSETVDLSNYYTKTEVYTKTEIDEKGYLTEHQSLSDYATTAYVDEAIAEKTEDVKTYVNTAIRRSHATVSDIASIFEGGDS